MSCASLIVDGEKLAMLIGQADCQGLEGALALEWLGTSGPVGSHQDRCRDQYTPLNEWLSVENGF